MIDERIRGKGQYDLRRRQLAENTSDKRKLYLGKSSLIEKENRAAGARLSSTNFLKDVVDLFFEWTVTDNDPVVIYFVSMFN